MKKPKKSPRAIGSERIARGRKREGVSFPASSARAGLPDGYAGVLAEIKQRIQAERLRVVMAANSAMVLLYWDIGRLILERQEREGWGAKVIDRLSADLREVYPDMSGLSPRNLKYMRSFAAAWPDQSIVQQLAAQIPWFHQNGWSRSILELQIRSQAHARQGKAITNFALTLPPEDSDMAAHVFKDPYLFDFLGTADPRREREVEQALIDHILCHAGRHRKAVGVIPAKAGIQVFEGIVDFLDPGFRRGDGRNGGFPPAYAGARRVVSRGDGVSMAF